MRRPAVLCKKIGMSSFFFTDTGERFPITLLSFKSSTFVRSYNIDNKDFVDVAFGLSSNKISRPLIGYFKSNNVEPRLYIRSFRTSSFIMPKDLDIHVSYFNEGDKVDISGLSIGKGFAGSMKRHNFRGLRATHGVSISHRSHGSTGQRQDPGRVFKGKKMAGHMGNKRVTMMNLKILKIFSDENYLAILGATPGHKGSLLEIRDARKAG